LKLNKLEFQKWTATLILIVGSAVNGWGVYPAGPLLLAVGGLIWLAVAVQIQDRALIVTNAVMTAVTAAALALHYIKG
jgi:hypothetical protein